MHTCTCQSDRHLGERWRRRERGEKDKQRDKEGETQHCIRH